MTENQGPAHKRDMTRRKVLIASGAAVAAVGAGGGLAVNAFADESTGATGSGDTGTETCYQLTSENIEGPYYIDADKIRTDLTEDQEGIPMLLQLKVIDAKTCRPVANAAVDIWHCNALGVYSGYESASTGGGGTPPTGEPPTDPPTGDPSGPPPGGGGMHQEPTDDDRFLRGTWKTDKHGFVMFKTVFPGWYQGRAVHIHVKVHVDGTWTHSGYEGGHTCHTGQFFFAESAVLASAEAAPYASNTTTRTTLDEDFLYGGNGAQDGLLALKYNKHKIAGGVRASLTMGVTPAETHDGDEGMPGPTASPSASASG